MKKPKPYPVTRQIIAHYSAFDEMFVHKAVNRGHLNSDDLGSICLWLAENGTPELRARMAQRIVPVIMGMFSRDHADNDTLIGHVENIDLALKIFKMETRIRQARAEKIRKNRPGAGKKKKLAAQD